MSSARTRVVLAYPARSAPWPNSAAKDDDAPPQRPDGWPAPRVLLPAGLASSNIRFRSRSSWHSRSEVRVTGSRTLLPDDPASVGKTTRAAGAGNGASQCHSGWRRPRSLKSWDARWDPYPGERVRAASSRRHTVRTIGYRSNADAPRDDARSAPPQSCGVLGRHRLGHRAA